MTNPSTWQQPVAATDALRPADIAQRIEAVSVERADLTTRKLIVLGVLGGIYVGLGGALATLALTDSGLGFGLARLSAGVAFSLGLILLVIAGGELFTGNNLMVLAAFSRRTPLRASLSAVRRTAGRQCCAPRQWPQGAH
jgi:formate/nitrite transporter FocA (FNT family)